MKDKELDQMLKKALTQDIRDDETKIKFEMGDYSMKKRKTYIKPAVALVACAALVVGVASVSYTHLDVYKRQAEATGFIIE